MEYKKLDVCPPKNPSVGVKVTEMGNIFEVQYMSRRNSKATIQMLPGGSEYMVLSSGEVKDCVHHDSRSDLKKNLLRTFASLRAIINTNVVDVSKARFLTLTYAENMQDTNRLYVDFKYFVDRFRYYCKSKGFSSFEYIAVAEPQARGAWHLHVIFIFSSTAPFIPNSELAEIWGHGFVRVTAIDKVDNVGAYLTAYLTDMELTECMDDLPIGETFLVKEIFDETSEQKKKPYVKGARLRLYPAGFRIFRCSRGIKRPTPEMMSLEDAETLTGKMALTYEKTVLLSDTENDFETVINTRYFNKLR